MQVYLDSLEAACLDASNSQEISALLLESQSVLKYSSFQGFGEEDVKTILKAVWKFLLFAATNPLSSTRLLAYQTTGGFLLKLTPYFPLQIQGTFSDVSMMSTIDIKSSAIIASAFAFISHTIAFPYLQSFLDSTPVFHHFAISDPIFSEHLSAIISNLGNLGLDWYRTLLHSFLAAVANSQDQALIKSITAIVRHHSIELMNEILDVVQSQENFRSYLSLISFILSSPHFELEGLELYGVACQSLQVLADATSTVTQLDSALQLLSVHSTSFSVVVDPVSDSVVKLTVGNSRGESHQSDIDITPLKSRPSLWLLHLPFRYALPDFGNDGSLTIVAKFGTLCNCVHETPVLAGLLFEIVERHINSPNFDVMSACLKSLARCFSEFESTVDAGRVHRVVQTAVVIGRTTWYHAVNILKVIGVAGRNPAILSDFLLHIIVDSCISTNNKLIAKAKKCLMKLITQDNFERITSFIAKRVDLLNDSNMTRLLRVLTFVVERCKRSRATSHLNGLIYQVLEMANYSKDNLPVLDSIFGFLGCCDLSAIQEDLIVACLEKAMSNIIGFFQLFSGEDWGYPMKASHLQRSMQMIDTHLKSLSVDIVTETSLNYRQYCWSLLKATGFVVAVPPRLVDKAFAFTFINKLLKIFPSESSQLQHRFWGQFTLGQTLDLLKTAIGGLRNTQDFQAATVLFQLLIQWQGPLKYDAQSEVAKIASFIVDNPWTRPTPRQLLYFRAFLHFIKRAGQPGDPDLEDIVLNTCTHLFEPLFGKKPPPLQPPPPPAPREVAKIYVNEMKWEVFRSKSSDLGIIKSQLLGATYNFTARELGLLFVFFCKIGDVKGVELLLRFASARRISLRINVGNVPDSGLVFLLNYYRVVDPAKSQELAKQLLSRSCPEEVELAAISLLPDDYLGRISTATKHAKHELRVFAIATSSVRFDSQLLQGTLNSCLQHSISAKKLPFFMMSVIHSVSSFKSISDPFVANLIAFFKARESDIIVSQVGRCVNLLSDLSSSWRLTAFVTDLLPTVCAISAEGALLYSAASQSKELFQLMATKSLRDFFSQRLPSLYCYGFRLLIRGLQLNMPEGSVKSMLKGVLPKLVETFPEFVTIPSIAEASGGFWTIILSMKNFRQRVLSAFNVLMPPLSSPAFPALSFCLPMILLITQSDRGLSDLNKQIMQLLPELLTTPILLPFLRIYLKCSVIRADKMPFAAERLTFLGNTAKSLCGQTLEDCYWISDVLHELFEFALMHGGPKVLINLIKGMVSKIRFFSLLVGLLKLRKSLQAKPVMDPAQFAWDVMAVEVETQCHLKALELMKEPTQIGFALELAGFDKDCEECEWVVRARTREQEVTEVVRPDPWLDMFQRISGTTFEPIVEAEAADGA